MYFSPLFNAQLDRIIFGLNLDLNFNLNFEFKFEWFWFWIKPLLILILTNFVGHYLEKDFHFGHVYETSKKSFQHEVSREKLGREEYWVGVPTLACDTKESYLLFGWVI